MCFYTAFGPRVPDAVAAVEGAAAATTSKRRHDADGECSGEGIDPLDASDAGDAADKPADVYKVFANHLPKF